MADAEEDTASADGAARGGGAGPWWWRRGIEGALDRVAAVLAVAGVACWSSGLLPEADAAATMRRVLPLLLFLGTVVVLAELTAGAGVFDVIAVRLAILARGRYSVLFGLGLAFAALTTTVLNLDTTAVLLTPVMLALAGRVGLPPLPLAVTTVWLANTGSLLLPVSNLTNLLAADRVALPTPAFAARMWLPALAAVAVTAACLWWFFWLPAQPPGGRFRPPGRLRPGDAVRFRAAAAACALFLLGVLLGAPLWTASTVGAVLLLTVTALRAPRALSWSLLPLRLLAFVTGMFLVVETAAYHGLNAVVAHLIGSGGGTTGLLRTAGAGAVLANAVNNLPAYLAGEAAVPGPHRTQLLALLVGVNAGAVVLPWASLAVLLWYERCRAHGVRIPLRRFGAAGAVLAVLAVAAAAAALAFAG